jgi:osmotically-inducible protein OsmY
MSDRRLKDAVLVELHFELRTNASHIEVSASDGVVRLAGHVQNFMEKLLAKRIAALVPGVKAVTEELGVAALGGFGQADNKLLERALHILFWDVAIPPDRVKVGFDRGWITLSGELDTPFQKHAAEMDVRNIRGVIGVTNEITIAPTARPVDMYQRIERTLEQGAHI